MTLAITRVTGSALNAYIPDLARLRIRVFREYPYLYDGSESYEQRYLETYARCDQAMAILALDNTRPLGERVIGASTGIPMRHETEAFKQPFADAGIDPATIFYCGESVLLPAYRGQGLYKQFFSGREDYAGQLGGLSSICFCGVVRPQDHPLRPEGYQPLDAVWRHFGYRPQAQLVAQFDWKDIDQPEQTSHPMQFWLKSL
jgi:GNAT superfamily N-acetyltransferase